MRTLAIDIGTRRVGLAMSDEGGQIATPMQVLQVSSPENAAAQILQFISGQGVQRLLLGVPINMDETLGKTARSAIAWGQSLANTAGLPIVFVDERLSSFEAEQTLNQRKRDGEKMTRKAKSRLLDALVAAQLLQAFLNGTLLPLDVNK
jgi:putative Holliday junction resolvase